LGLRDPAPKPLRLTPTLTPPRPRAWPLNSYHAPARATPALRCGCTLVCTPRQVFQNKKMRTFSSPTMCSARDAVDSGRGARALARFRHVHAKMRWLCRALLPAAHVAPTVSLHTPFVDSSVSKKRHQRATLLESAVFFKPRCSSPVALCIAGGRGCCPLAPLTLSRRIPFFG
jgi:hypothetical protein